VDSVNVLEAVPATRVRREWAAVRDQLRSVKTLALTSHDRVDAVLLEPSAYAALVASAADADQAMLSKLTERFDARLAALAAPDAHSRLLRAFESDELQGDAVAGSSF
jgi:PHD/YefM family antitoxin component YafN of YafNO toxin-antitoxin module